jgi:hypothetical protein
LKGRIAATACCWQRRLWAGHVSYIAVRPRLCKARFLRIAAVGMADGESRLSTLHGL